MMKKIKTAGLFCLIVVLLFTFKSSVLLASSKYEKRSKLLLGTLVEVTAAESDAFDIVFDEIERIEKLLSKYNPDSEISRLNLYGKVIASTETIFVIKRSINLSQKTKGAFDITVAPAVGLWKTAIKKRALPEDKEIDQIKQFINSGDIEIDDATSRVSFAKKRMRVDLGAIAKGYAVDSAVQKLRQKGILSCLINAGGDIYGLGMKGNKPWSVGIRHPRNPEGFIDSREVIDKAVATSGDYEQFFIIDNKRYSHIINPKTARPIDSDVISVTVIAPDCFSADALATAVFVLGKEEGKKLVSEYGDTEIIVYTDEDLNE